MSLAQFENIFRIAARLSISNRNTGYTASFYRKYIDEETGLHCPISVLRPSMYLPFEKHTLAELTTS